MSLHRWLAHFTKNILFNKYVLVGPALAIKSPVSRGPSVASTNDVICTDTHILHFEEFIIEYINIEKYKFQNYFLYQ